ncbi:MAG TPA: hypothetical protein VIS74_07005 [Chthoniobacterales bacterium]
MNRNLISRVILPAAVLGFATLSSLQAQSAPPAGGPPEEAPPTAGELAAYLAKLDAVPGYGGIAFGGEIAKSKDSLVLEQDRGPLKIYKKKGETLLLGPALLETVLYYFYEGKLYGVAFHTNDGQDSVNLKSILHSAFGPGVNSAEGGPSTIWLGKKVGALFELNTSTGDASAFLFDQAAHDAYLKYESDAGQKAAELLLKGK